MTIEAHATISVVLGLVMVVTIILFCRAADAADAERFPERQAIEHATRMAVPMVTAVVLAVFAIATLVARLAGYL